MQNVYPEFFECLYTGIGLLIYDIIFESEVSQGLVVGYLGQTWDSLVLRSNKTPQSPALSEAGRRAAYRLTRSDLWGEWKTLVFPLGAALDSLLRRYFALTLSYFSYYTSQLTYHILFYTD